MSNNRIDNIMHKNTYNTDVNKKLNLQEDIEKLEEQKTILRDMVKAVSEENDSLQEKHEELLMKQAVGYDGWEEDLATFQTLMEEAKSELEKCSEEVDITELAVKVREEKTYSYSSRYLREEYYKAVDKLEEHCSKYPVLTIKSKDYLERSSIVSNLRSSLDNVIEPYIKEAKELSSQLKATKKKEEEYTKYLSEERKTGMWCFLGGCLVATVITLMLK